MHFFPERRARPCVFIGFLCLQQYCAPLLSPIFHSPARTAAKTSGACPVSKEKTAHSITPGNLRGGKRSKTSAIISTNKKSKGQKVGPDFLSLYTQTVCLFSAGVPTFKEHTHIQICFPHPPCINERPSVMKIREDVFCALHKTKRLSAKSPALFLSKISLFFVTQRKHRSFAQKFNTRPYSSEQRVQF